MTHYHCRRDRWAINTYAQGITISIEVPRERIDRRRVREIVKAGKAHLHIHAS